MANYRKINLEKEVMENQTEKLFDGFWGEHGLNKEIEKRGYQNIEGLKALIDEKTYWHFLECLPPLRFDGNVFYLMEFLSGDLTLKFWKEDEKYFCEVVKLVLSESER